MTILQSSSEVNISYIEYENYDCKHIIKIFSAQKLLAFQYTISFQ